MPWKREDCRCVGLYRQFYAPPGNKIPYLPMIRFISIGIKPRQTSTVGQNAQSEINIGFIVFASIVIKDQTPFRGRGYGQHQDKKQNLAACCLIPYPGFPGFKPSRQRQYVLMETPSIPLLPIPSAPKRANHGGSRRDPLFKRRYQLMVVCEIIIILKRFHEFYKFSSKFFRRKQTKEIIMKLHIQQKEILIEQRYWIWPLFLWEPPYTVWWWMFS